MKRIKASLITAINTLSFLILSGSARAQFESKAQEGVNAAGGGSTASVEQIIQSVANILIFIVGAISVIMIIVGGLRYVLSGGDAKAVGDAKNTVLYAVVGLVVAFGAFAIVNFVLVRI